jgi:hypothetical protein
VALYAFWTDFKQSYDLCFPIVTTKLNRNIHKINGYMTSGLLVSRKNKLKLHKIALCDPLPVNVAKYKSYRNIFNLLVRKSKSLYSEDSLNQNVGNPKKLGKS